ncbi:hypothetical protein [Mariniluteicoccus flavus]
MDLDDLIRPGLALRVPRSSPHRALVAKLVGEKKLTRVLPGTYLRTSDVSRPRALAHAVCAYDVQAVLTGASAAALHLRRGCWRSTTGRPTGTHGRSRTTDPATTTSRPRGGRSCT